MFLTLVGDESFRFQSVMSLLLWFCRVELMDYLDSIDCSLEDFQALLYGKQFSIDPDLLEVPSTITVLTVLSHMLSVIFYKRYMFYCQFVYSLQGLELCVPGRLFSSSSSVLSLYFLLRFSVLIVQRVCMMAASAPPQK